MLSILALTVPVYAAIAAGYLATRRGLFAQDDMRVLSKFAVNFTLPALLFLAVATRPIGQVINATYMAAYAIGSLISLGIGVFYGRRVERTSKTAAAFYGMAVSCPNSGIIGYPVLLLAMPQVAGVILGLNMIVENILTIPLILILAERGEQARVSLGQELAGTVRRLLRNPMFDAIVLGLVISALRIPVPEVVVRSGELFARAVAGVSLFAVGGLLVGLPLRGTIRRISVLTVGKLLVHPALVAAALIGLVAIGMPGLDQTMRTALLLSAAMPVFAVYPVFAQRFGEGRLASAALLASTSAGFFTLTTLMTVLGVVPH